MTKTILKIWRKPDGHWGKKWETTVINESKKEEEKK